MFIAATDFGCQTEDSVTNEAYLLSENFSKSPLNLRSTYAKENPKDSLWLDHQEKRTYFPKSSEEKSQTAYGNINYAYVVG